MLLEQLRSFSSVIKCKNAHADLVWFASLSCDEHFAILEGVDLAMCCQRNPRLKVACHTQRLPRFAILNAETGGDQMIDLPGEPGHNDLCAAEQAFVLHAIAKDLDLTRHMNDAVQSLAICLAADQSIRTGQPVTLPVSPKEPCQ